MYLKRLDLHGFKTFAGKTRFEFAEGITAVVGPNGSGKCLVGTTLVTLADGREVAIRDLVETALSQSPSVEPLDDGSLTRHNPRDIRILSLNPETLRLEPRPVAAFVKRTAPPTLLQIRTRSGRSVTATPYHPLFTLKEGELHALRADELKVGVRVAVPGGSLAGAEILWDEIVNIETIPPPDGWVYDLSVAETHNFVAGNMIVHNSNLADAVRWILGEQRATVLRARRSEDLIFSGTERRARLGMAQALLTLDNSAGLLPIDFAEVVVGRRAFRTGESEFLLNGAKVRLRDIHELLAHAGIGVGTYTVIGQGLVDAALALRAEERRQLFEDAAGLGAYQGRRDEALRRLAQTDDHLTRVRDILAEIEPQLGRLRRQAERADEFLGLREALGGLLQQWYGFRWGQAALALAEAQAAAAEARKQRDAAAATLAATEQRLAALRQRQGELRATLEQGRRERGQQRAEAERLRRERAVVAERERGLLRQRDTLQQENEAVEAEAADLQRRRAALAEEGARLDGARSEAQAALAASQRALADAEAGRETLRAALDEARRAAGSLAAREGEIAQQRRALAERQQALAAERASHDRALAELTLQLEQRATELRQLEAEVAAQQAGRAALATERDALAAARQPAGAAQRERQQALHEVERRLTEATTRRDVLARLRREGAGYESGVRALLAERGRFNGALLGPVADLLRVPEPLAVAVSAALGERLQAVAARDDGGALRGWLQAREAGRVTLLPLPGLRRAERPPLPEGAGILGRGSELVEADDPTLLDWLLGGWLVVEDWATVERLGAADGWNLVTLDGQVRARRGAIGAGRGAGRATTLLAQSREWADLPARLAALEAEQATARAALDEASGALHGLERRLDQLERDGREQERQAQRATAALERERRDAEKLQQEQRWRGEGLARLAAEATTADERERTLRAEGERLGDQRRLADARMAQAEQALEAAHPGPLREAVERARLTVAVADEQRAGWQRARQTLDEAQARLAQRQQASARQATQLAEEGKALAGRAATLEAEAQRAEAALAAALAQARPLEAEQAATEQALAEAETQLGAERRAWQARDEARHAAQLAQQAADERLAHLRADLAADLGAAEPDDEDATLAPSPSVEELVASLPKVTALPDGLENDVRRLRRRLAGLGAINPDAPAEFAALAERHRFLAEQSDDLSRAAADLRRLGAELDAIMRERFLATFAAVDEAFQGLFARLFGGGQARLELTEPEAPMTTGVEIVARPPGKRAQSISLLSGGERALTAAALVFAILRVSPAPFCVLDEVDAMLDEANVGRFRDLLAELAQETQFIVITHNRGTIEVASAIYGISQRDPGVSEVISLRLDEAMRVAKH